MDFRPPTVFETAPLTIRVHLPITIWEEVHQVRGFYRVEFVALLLERLDQFSTRVVITPGKLSVIIPEEVIFRVQL